MKNVEFIHNSSPKILHISYFRHRFQKKKSFIENVQEVVYDNISCENFGITELCKELCLSRSQVHNKIKTATNLSTSIFIRSLKLERAKILLKNSDCNISEIAYQIGYKDPSYFSRLFTEKYNVTPSKFRKDIQKKILAKQFFFCKNNLKMTIAKPPSISSVKF